MACYVSSPEVIQIVDNAESARGPHFVRTSANDCQTETSVQIRLTQCSMHQQLT